MILSRLFAILSLIFSASIYHTANAHDASILVLSTNHVSESKLILFSKLALENNIRLDYQYLKNITKGASLSKLVEPYNMVIFDSISGSEAIEQFSIFENLVRNNKRLFLPIKHTGETKLRRGFSEDQTKILYDYYESGGEENLRQMIVYLGNQFFGHNDKKASPPIIFPNIGIYYPDYAEKVFPDFQSYKNWKRVEGTIPAIGISMSRETIAAGDTTIIDALVKAIESKGALAVPFYFPVTQEGDIANLLSSNGVTYVDNIINTLVIHWPEKRRNEFEKLGVSVIQALYYYSGDKTAWMSDKQGIPSQALPFYLTIPENSGIIDPTIVSARDEKGQKQIIDYQLDSVVEKALKFAVLKRKDNAKKRIAIMFYNYPVGEKSVGASHLNVPTSLVSIFDSLSGAGYKVDNQQEQWFIDQTSIMLKPQYRKASYAELLGSGREDGAGGLLPVSVYRKWYKTLPKPTRDDIERHWGQPEESFSVEEVNGEKQFIIPRSISGNIMIMPQPPRGNKLELANTIYHDKKLPVSHNYLAAYFYAREQFKADAIVHLGTHGSQEYLSGKERGLSVYDSGKLAVGSTPIIYPFIMDDVGEAIQAKRRGSAVIISHLTPPFSKSGLYGELVDLHELMHRYRELDDGGVKSRTEKSIIEACIKQNILADLGWTESELHDDFQAFLLELHEYLVGLGATIQPLGLHTFGKTPNEEHLVSTLVQMSGKSLVEPATHYIESNQHEHEHEHEHEHAHHKYDHGNARDYLGLKHSPEYQVIQKFVIGDGDIASIKDGELRSLLEDASTNYKNFKSIEENSALLEALSGKYVSSGNGGDPIRSPNALPSGKNLYGFDPSMVPTKEAWEEGKTLIADLIENYHNKHGTFPDKLTFSLWSIETMRHYGVVESQVMYAMGVRPKWGRSGNIIGTEIIPYSELERPRVDVVLSATGLYRDAFPNTMKMLSKAIDAVAKLKEENNFVFSHAQKIKQELIAEGIDEMQAEILSTIRVFSNESGNYNTNLGKASIASDTWNSDAKLANLYLSRVGYFYGSNDSTWGQKLPNIDLYAKNLSGTDAAIFSRSSNLYGLLTSDDPFQYMGGISLAVRHLDGKSPEMFISNLRDPENNKSVPLGKMLANELRTRYFHPQWIKEIQNEGYAGTLTTLDVINNLWGWQVMDPEAVRD
ncbi:MAG: cobaltochelatase subunit CobN, partial [Candidatus Thiodiazotropha sp.]